MGQLRKREVKMTIAEAIEILEKRGMSLFEIELHNTILNALREYQKASQKCSFGENIAICPDGKHELSPHRYQEKQVIHNATVQILECEECRKVSVAWSKQEDSWEE